MPIGLRTNLNALNSGNSIQNSLNIKLVMLFR
jgi:hypothetical protein